MARGIQISDAARARREGLATRLAEMRFSVGMNSSFFTWNVNPTGLSRWGSEDCTGQSSGVLQFERAGSHMEI